MRDRLGPSRITLLLGAIVAELVRTHRVANSVRAGIGAVVGLVAGAVAHVALALVMVALFAWWVWRG